MKLYEGARHEFVNETIRDAVTSDVMAWLDETIGAAGGTALLSEGPR